MPPRRQADARHATEVHAFIERTLRSNLEGGVLLECLENVFRAIREDAKSAPFLLLPIRVCQAAGGQAEKAIGVSAAWCMLHTAALLLDDVEDRDLDSKPWPPIRPSQAINAASALIVASQLALIQPCAPEPEGILALRLGMTFGRDVLQVCEGQHLDLSGDSFSLDKYWRMAANKSGAFFALACRAGAMVAVDDKAMVDGYAEFGYNLGILLQISDDLNGVWNPIGRSDLVTGSRTLPLVYALSVADPMTRNHLLELVGEAATSTQALSSAQQMLADLGALQYLVVEAQRFRLRAERALRSQHSNLPAFEWLEDLLNKISPVSAKME